MGKKLIIKRVVVNRPEDYVAGKNGKEERGGLDHMGVRRTARGTKVGPTKMSKGKSSAWHPGLTFVEKAANAFSTRK